jgi:putative Ca2+/H+ antiporter (TMEM165/GDT1 family)
MHSLHLALYIFGVIFVAELPDKTALAALVLATRHKAVPVFLGASAALTVQSLVAVAAGSLLSFLPARPVHIGAGLLFLVAALLMWLRKGETERTESSDKDEPTAGSSVLSFWRTFATVFGVVFIAEWGDLTQLATAAFAARERAPVIVFAASALALWSVTAIAVGIGNRAAKLLHPELMQKAAATLFAAVGVALLAGWL